MAHLGFRVYHFYLQSWEAFGQVPDTRGPALEGSDEDLGSQPAVEDLYACAKQAANNVANTQGLMHLVLVHPAKHSEQVLKPCRRFSDMYTRSWVTSCMPPLLQYLSNFPAAFENSNDRCGRRAQKHTEQWEYSADISEEQSSGFTSDMHRPFTTHQTIGT